MATIDKPPRRLHNRGMDKHPQLLPKAAAIFGSRIDCPCGRTHQIEPQSILYADDAIAAVPRVCQGHAAGGAALVLMDARTRGVAGEAIAEALGAAGWQVTRAIVPDPAPGQHPVCDDLTYAALQPAVAGAHILVNVGSGVINDLGKWLSADAGKPCISFATAASMNGYTSANIAPTLAGVKSLRDSRPPRAVLADPAILAAAPYEMTVAGLGDVLAKSVSSADWRLNSVLFGDYYCLPSVELIAEIEPLYLANPHGIAQRQPRAMAALYEALLLTGAAMTMAGTSAPASGGEHMVSHALDMMSSLDGSPHDLHGRQVGVGTIVAAEVYRRVLAAESPRWTAPTDEIDAAFWGPMAPMVAQQYSAKLPRMQQAAAKLRVGSAWDALRGELSAMVRPPQAIRECLRTAGGATTAADLGMSPQRVLAAMRHAHEIRSRFTVLDLAMLAGVLPHAWDDVASEWL